MRIIRNNFYTVVKLWINQFGVMFLGFLVLLPSAGSKVPDWVMPAVSLFTVLFYLVLIFWVTLEVGLQDNVRLECGRIRKQWYKGTVLALAANLPSLLASVIACISKALIPGVDYFASANGHRRQFLFHFHHGERGSSCDVQRVLPVLRVRHRSLHLCVHRASLAHLLHSGL